MKILIAFIVLLSSLSFAAESVPESSSAPDSSTQAQFADTLNKKPARAPQSTKEEPQADHSGCCSYHNGVCGCSNGRAMCCDGIASPSCGCN